MNLIKKVLRFQVKSSSRYTSKGVGMDMNQVIVNPFFRCFIKFPRAEQQLRNLMPLSPTRPPFNWLELFA